MAERTCKNSLIIKKLQITTIEQQRNIFVQEHLEGGIPYPDKPGDGADDRPDRHRLPRKGR